MIIVEGPDGAGKSTLVRELCGQFHLEQGERGTTDRRKLYTVTVPDTFNALTQAVQGRDAPKVWDRLFYSEMVYHDLVGRDCEFSSTQQVHIRRMIDALRCPVIVCLPPTKVIVANARAAEQMKGVNENIEKIVERYWSMLTDEVFPEHTQLFDYTGMNWRLQPPTATRDAIFDEVQDYLNDREGRVW